MRKPRYYPCGGEPTKCFKLAISEVANNTFNTGKNKFSTQFTLLCNSTANDLATNTVRTEETQVTKLPKPIIESKLDAEDLMIIGAQEVETKAKRRLTFVDSLKKGYTTV